MKVAGLIIRAVIAFLLCAIAHGASAAPSPEEPRSAITILVDLSSTWHNDQSKGHNQNVLEAVTEAVIELGRHYRPPVHVRVLPIGDASFLRPPLCNAVFDPKLIGAQKDGVFIHERPFRKYLKSDCIRYVLTRPREKLTDISGAIDSAARLTTAQLGQEKALIILSDMLEERAKGSQAPTLSLPGYKVAIVYRALEADRRNPAALLARVELWRKKLSTAGASVEAIPDQTLSPPQITRLLRK